MQLDRKNLSFKEKLEIVGVPPKNIVKILTSIEKARKGTPLHKIIYALGIPGVGEYTSEKLAEYFIENNINIYDIKSK